MKKHWVLVANATHARLLQQQERGTPMAVLKSFSHPDARSKIGELGDDRASREDLLRNFGGTAYQPQTGAIQKAYQRFARELAEYVERHAQLGSFDSFSVFASSPFLGQLKAEIGAATGRRLVGTHDLDLTSVGAVELPRRIEYELARGTAAAG